MCIYVPITRDLGDFPYLKLETSFWKAKTFLRKLEVYIYVYYIYKYIYIYVYNIYIVYMYMYVCIYMLFSTEETFEVAIES